MSDYPPAVAAIVADYLDRVRTLVPQAALLERDDLVKELRSHVYEAYQQTPGDDEVARVLSVLRRLGEPADVVSDRLPQAVVRSGTERHLPLQILGGIVIALFGIPLGFAGVATLAGMLVSLAAVVVSYYAVVGSVLLTGAVFLALGFVRIYGPELWDRLQALGIVSMDPHTTELLDHLSPAGQGVLMILVGTLCVAIAIVMVWLGIYLVRGLRFSFLLAWDGMRRLAQTARGALPGQERRGRPAPAAAASALPRRPPTPAGPTV
jgi:uncharacterized membrane protein